MAGAGEEVNKRPMSPEREHLLGPSTSKAHETKPDVHGQSGISLQEFEPQPLKAVSKAGHDESKQPTSSGRRHLVGLFSSKAYETKLNAPHPKGGSPQELELQALRQIAGDCPPNTGPRISHRENELVVHFSSVSPHEARYYYQTLGKLLKKIPGLPKEMLNKAPTAPGDIIIAGSLATALYNVIHSNRDAAIYGACGVLGGHVCNMFLDCLKASLQKYLGKKPEHKATQKRDLRSIPHHSLWERSLEHEADRDISDAWLAVDVMGMEWSIPELLDNSHGYHSI